MRSNLPVLLLTLGVLLLSACTPIQAPAAAPGEEALQPEPAAIRFAGDVPRITQEEAKAHFDNGTAVFLDARGQVEYDREHIAGALARPTVPLAELGDTLPKDQLIITYCT